MPSVILKKDLFQEVLLKPAENYDELCIVSGFATPAMVVHHLEAVQTELNKTNLKINLIVGMTSQSGISKAHHENFVKLMNEKKLFKCSYMNLYAEPTHTKLYVWLNQNIPQLAFLTSANYTLNAFRHRQDEIATECDSVEAYQYYNNKTNVIWDCNCEDAKNLVRSFKKSPSFVVESAEEELATSNTEIGTEGIDWVKLPLFSERYNKIHEHSGLNWGQRDKRDPNQAYIPVPSIIAQSGFFPPRGLQFSVITSDGFPFVCVIAQDNDKAIHTTNDNSELGRNFRSRLGLQNGDFVELSDLDRFGNRYVKFTKINEEEYYMEFDPEYK